MSSCDHRCGDCQHFVEWSPAWNITGDEPDGVCTAPRPLLGQAPNREVSRKGGKGCHAFIRRDK